MLNGRLHISKVMRLLLVVFLLGIVQDTGFAQEVSEETEIAADSKREEVQRYFGYELLLYRYLTLPYDMSMNVNEHGPFVEIGFIYILFFPIILLLLARNKRWLFFGILVYLIFNFIISTSNSFVYSKTIPTGKIATTQEAIGQYLEAHTFNEEPVAYLVASFTDISLALYQPLLAFAQNISGDRDPVTYPIILTGFLFISLLLIRLSKEMKAYVRNLLVLFWSYAFLWFAFAGGIIWYGYILLFLGYFTLVIFIEHILVKDRNVGLWLKRGFIAAGVVWIMMAFVSRLSNIQIIGEPEQLGKGVFNPVFYEYGLGLIEDDDVLEKIYPNVNHGITLINRDSSALVWRVGTSFTYFIENNTDRVIMDNQLGMFYDLRKTYPNNAELAEVFKASNIRYIIVDLNTAQIDKTPNKTLTEKYRSLLEFIYKNPKLELLATDRILQRNNENNNIEYFYGDFGTIYQFGRYAIYRIK